MTPLFLCLVPGFISHIISFMQRELRAFRSDLDRLLLEPKAVSR